MDKLQGLTWKNLPFHCCLLLVRKLLDRFSQLYNSLIGIVDELCIRIFLVMFDIDFFLQLCDGVSIVLDLRLAFACMCGRGLLLVHGSVRQLLDTLSNARLPGCMGVSCPSCWKSLAACFSDKTVPEGIMCVCLVSCGMGLGVRFVVRWRMRRRWTIILLF